jgi:hypothetical protein
MGTTVYALNEHGSNRFQAQVTKGHIKEPSSPKTWIGDEESEANANLLAAAPDLLAALKVMVGTFRPCSKPIGALGSLARRQWEDECDAYRQAEDVIRKAEGN